MERQNYPGLLLIAAIAGAALIPKSAATTEDTEPPAKASVEQQRLRPDPPLSYWPLFSDFLASQQNGAPAESVEKQPDRLVNSGFRFEHLIVTVPDPEGTAYPHSFDETIESVRYALEQEDYTFDRFWLPWRPKAQQDDKTPPPAGMPGVILFRHEPAKKVLAVFLVGENPRSGLDKVAFLNTVDAIRRLSGNRGPRYGNPRKLRVLGPTFSGSIFSLRMALKQLHDCDTHRTANVPGQNHGGVCTLAPIDDVTVVSGSATSKDNAERLKAGIDSRRDYGFQVTYSGMLENDDRVLGLFSDYMEKTNPDAMIAFLTESGSVFGDRVARAAKVQTTAVHGNLYWVFKNLADYLLPAWLKGPDEPPRDVRWIVLRFPMDISGVRRAYLEDPDLKKFWSAKKGMEEALPQLSVGGSVRTTGNIPTFAPEETSPARDNTLRAMFGMLTRRSVDMVGIAATNTTDSLFLAALMHKYAPNARPFVLDADVLFLGSPHGVPMTGMLFATNYPLFMRNQSWTGSTSARNGLRQFTSRYAESIYNACQTAMDGKHLIEHAWPFHRGSDKRPPVWLTVAGNDSFWPVALLDSDTQTSTVADDHRHVPALPRPSKIWTLLYFVLACWCIVHAVAFVYHNYMHRESEWMSLYWLDPNGEKQLSKRVYLGIATLCLFVLLVSLGMIHLWASAHRDPLMVRLFMIMLFAVPSGLLLANFTALAFPRVGFSQYLYVAGAFALISIGALPFIDLDWFDSDDLYGMFFIFRSLNPGNGVSPLMSVALLIVGIYSWTMSEVRRLRTYELRRACLPQLTADMTFAAGQADVADRLSRAFRDWVCCRKLFWTAILFIAISAFTFIRWAMVNTFERPWFNAAYETMLIALYAVVVLSMVRFMAGWIALRRLLMLLEWHPIRTAFGELGAFSWTTLWKRGASRQTFTTTIASFEKLRQIVYTPEAGPVPVGAGSGAAAQPATIWTSVPGLIPAVAEFEADLSVLLDRETRGLRQPVDLYRDVQEKLLGISHALERNVLSPFWQQSRADDRGWTATHKAAEDFVALRFVSYIRYAMLQLREQLEFVSTAFIVTLLSLNMYPFEPRRSIISGVTMLFIAVGACTVYVFMQMDRNALMSRLAQTKADKLDMNFVLRLASYGALPLLTLLGTYFPWAGSMFRSWVQPALDAMK
jgi:hypothetical protein